MMNRSILFGKSLPLLILWFDKIDLPSSRFIDSGIKSDFLVSFDPGKVITTAKVTLSCQSQKQPTYSTTVLLLCLQCTSMLWWRNRVDFSETLMQNWKVFLFSQWIETWLQRFRISLQITWILEYSKQDTQHPEQQPFRRSCVSMITMIWHLQLKK